ncbi:MAG: FIST N-terminal domain-containing protein, partial [Arcobacteraceae bacterium]
MRVLNHIFEDFNGLNAFINKDFGYYKSLLIQIFSGTDDTSLIQNILVTLKNKLPNSHIIGASTSGEIIEGEVLKNSIIISLSF